MYVHYPHSLLSAHRMVQFQVPSIDEEQARLLFPWGRDLLNALAYRTQSEQEFVLISNRLLNKLVTTVSQPPIAALASSVYNNLQGLSRDPYTYAIYLRILGERGYALYNHPRIPLIEEAERVLTTAKAQGCRNTVVLTIYMKTMATLHYFPGVLNALEQGSSPFNSTHAPLLDMRGCEEFLLSLRHFTDTAELASHEATILSLLPQHLQQRQTIQQLSKASASSMELLEQIDGLHHTSRYRELFSLLTAQLSHQVKILNTLSSLLHLLSREREPRALLIALELCQRYGPHCQSSQIDTLHLGLLKKISLIRNGPTHISLFYKAQRILEYAHFQHRLSPALLESYLILCHQMSLPSTIVSPTLQWLPSDDPDRVQACYNRLFSPNLPNV